MPRSCSTSGPGHIFTNSAAAFPPLSPAAPAVEGLARPRDGWEGLHMYVHANADTSQPTLLRGICGDLLCHAEYNKIGLKKKILGLCGTWEALGGCKILP